MSKTTRLAVLLSALIPSGCSSSVEPQLSQPAEPSAQACTEEPEEPRSDQVFPVVLEEFGEFEEEPTRLDHESEDLAWRSDSPFDADAFDAVLGIGGGAGGRFGGRFGGKRIRSAAGSAHAAAESYAPVVEPGFRRVAADPRSTFSVDVDTASYTNVRRFLTAGSAPPADAVRIEELLNYFRYEDPAPGSDAPFSVTAEVASCPWQSDHRLVRIGLRAVDLELSELPAANLVFLVDVSGSMNRPDKLPLLVKGLGMLVAQLNDRDRVAIVSYAGSSGLVLSSTPCDRRATILAALERLEAGGSTAGAAGIRLAYQVARDNFVPGATNRVILATDGDFNVGVSDRGALEGLIRDEARSGVFLSVLGFGMGNLKDDRLETLADRGNGNYAYVDSLHEARRVLVEELGGTLVTVAKDVKIQVEFNPLEVQAWRQIGYENRALAHSDFLDDEKDAGEIGAGHTLTALFELVPVGVPFAASTDPSSETLRYQTVSFPSTAATRGELLQLQMRWKASDSKQSVGTTISVRDGGQTWGAASEDFRFAASVAAFGLVLRDSEHRAQATLAMAEGLAREALGKDAQGTRTDYIRLLGTARALGL